MKKVGWYCPYCKELRKKKRIKRDNGSYQTAECRCYSTWYWFFKTTPPIEVREAKKRAFVKRWKRVFTGDSKFTHVNRRR